MINDVIKNDIYVGLCSLGLEWKKQNQIYKSNCNPFLFQLDYIENPSVTFHSIDQILCRL